MALRIGQNSICALQANEAVTAGLMARGKELVN